MTIWSSFEQTLPNPTPNGKNTASFQPEPNLLHIYIYILKSATKFYHPKQTKPKTIRRERDRKLRLFLVRPTAHYPKARFFYLVYHFQVLVFFSIVFNFW